MKSGQIEIHNFYCLKCGKLSMPLPRKLSYQHSAFHRKKLYCPYCKMTLNHVEIRTEEERLEFLHNFEKGKFKKEVEESIKECNNQ